MKSPKPAKNQLAFVVHDEHNVPRYYELNRSLLKMLLIGLPTLTFISLACLVAGLVFYMNFINHFTINKITLFNGNPIRMTASQEPGHNQNGDNFSHTNNLLRFFLHVSP